MILFLCLLLNHVMEGQACALMPSHHLAIMVKHIRVSQSLSPLTICHPWMCKKRRFMFIALPIPGPKNPKDNQDIYIQPLIEELIQLWNKRIMTYDVSLRENFLMNVAIFGL